MPEQFYNSVEPPGHDVPEVVGPLLVACAPRGCAGLFGLSSAIFARHDEGDDASNKDAQ